MRKWTTTNDKLWNLNQKISMIEQSVSVTLVRFSGNFEASFRKLVTPYMTNGVSKLQTELDFQVSQKINKDRTTSEINFVIEQSHHVRPVQDLGFLEAGMWL